MLGQDPPAQADPTGQWFTFEKGKHANLYNERPTWLDLAHHKLDQAVFDAYGWPHDISDEEILARLLALNLERAKG